MIKSRFLHVFRHAALLFALALIFPSCFSEEPVRNPFDINLFTGIPGVVRLSESYQQVTEKTKYKWEKLEIDDNLKKKAGITEGIYFTDLGINVFFKRKSAVIIIMNPPFRGKISNKKISVFHKNSETTEWDKFVLKEFGTPEAKAAGGRMSSELSAYSWGDITLTRVGPIELTMYRDSEVKNYRVNNFSSGAALFPAK